jgi:hypothetical protein
MSAITKNRRIGLFTVGLVLFAVSGCIRESDEQGAHVIQFALWVPAAIFLGGIVAGAVGFFLRKHNTRLGWGLLIAGPFIGLGIAPSMMFERASVSKDAFEFQTGIYGGTVVPKVQFADVKQIRILAETKRTRRGGTSTTHYLMCQKSSGEEVRVPFNNDVAQKGVELVLKEAAARDIPVLDQTGGK